MHYVIGSFCIECLLIDIIHHLALPNNSLQSEGALLPTQLVGLLQWFRTLDLLNNTNFVGTIPSELGSMTALNSLQLSKLSRPSWESWPVGCVLFEPKSTDRRYTSRSVFALERLEVPRLGEQCIQGHSSQRIGSFSLSTLLL